MIGTASRRQDPTRHMFVVLHRIRAELTPVLLTPENTEILGGSVDHLEAEQPDQFTASLASRLEAAQTQLDAPKGRSRKTTATAKSKPAITRSKPKPAVQSRPTIKPSLSAPAARPSRAAAGPSTSQIDDKDNKEAARRARAEALRQLELPPRPIDSDDEYDVDDIADDSFIRGVEAAEAQAVTRSRYFQAQPVTASRAPGAYVGRSGYGSNTRPRQVEIEDEYDFDDDSFFREIDEAEIIASATTQRAAGVIQGSSGIARQTQASSGASTSDAGRSKTSRTRLPPSEIIEISD